MQQLAGDGLSDPAQFRRLERISVGIDERVCQAVEHGIKGRLCFQNVLLPGMNNYNGELVRVNRAKWLPVTGPVQTELLDVINTELRTVPTQHKAPKDAAQNRRDFEAAINHGPGDPGPTLSV